MSLMVKKIRSNFNSLEKMNKDIIALENRRTMPRTWKDFNKIQDIGNINIISL